PPRLRSVCEGRRSACTEEPHDTNQHERTRSMSNYDLTDFCGKTFIKPDDVRKKPKREIIADISKGRFDKLELTFESGSVLIPNGTNTRTLRRAYGNDSDALIGKEIELFLGTIPYNGTDNDAVLVKTISPADADSTTFRINGVGHVGLGAISVLGSASTRRADCR